jgi:hypothetical protein
MCVPSYVGHLYLRKYKFCYSRLYHIFEVFVDCLYSLFVQHSFNETVLQFSLRVLPNHLPYLTVHLIA